MNKIILIIIAAVIVAAGLPAQGQSAPQNRNYIVLAKQLAQLELIFLTAQELKEKDGVKTNDFQALICGKEVTELTDPQKMAPLIKRAEESGVQLVVCGFSLSMFKVDRRLIPDPIKIVDNGLLHAIELQQKGYISVSL
ncbi:MAG: hypothetical protein AB7V25_17575 [Mangrovibacterium sp.]